MGIKTSPAPFSVITITVSVWTVIYLPGLERTETREAVSQFGHGGQ